MTRDQKIEVMYGERFTVIGPSGERIVCVLSHDRLDVLRGATELKKKEGE